MATRKDQNRAAWDAAQKSTTESTLGLLADTRETPTNPINVEVRIPKVGDIVLHDTNKKVHFIARDSFKAAPTGWTIIGVVGAKRGTKALIVHKANTGKKWAEVFQWAISGAALSDGASHTGNLVIGDATYSFTWQTSSEADFAAALHTFVQTNHPTDQPYSCYVDTDGTVILQQDNYNTYKAVSLAGLTVAAHVGTELEANSSIYRKSGVTTYWGGMNFNKFLAYYSASGTTPTSQMAVTSVDVANKAAFKTNAFCDLLRAKWCVDPTNPTDADYENYIKDCMCVVPDTRGIFAEQFRDGKANTYKLVGVTFKRASDGERIAKYPAAEYCAAAAFSGVKGLDQGDWFLPSMEELADLIGPVSYPTPNSNAANADALNRGLKAIGGSQVGNGSYIWTSCRYSTYSAWIFDGSNGYAFNISFYNSVLAVPVALYEIPAGDE